MERASKERNAEVKRKIRKVWLPFLLCVLIVVNLMVVPKIFENNGVVFQSVSMPIGIEEGSIQLLPPVAVRIDKNNDNGNVGRNEDEINVNDDNDNVVVISKESSGEVGKESVVEQNDNNNNNNVNKEKKGERRHVQHRGFRLFLFLLIVIIVMLIFLMIIYNNEKNYEYSQSRANIYSSQLNNGGNNNNNNNNGYSKLPDEYYDNH